mgnify:CR=1 FL=1
MAYVDGFVIPVPADRRAQYLELAEKAAPIFMDHGALRVVECWGNDVPHGKTTDFHMAVRAEGGENVIFSWIVWPSREARDAGNAKAMEDPRMQGEMPDVFDGKRMIFGGFEVLYDTAEGA